MDVFLAWLMCAYGVLGLAFAAAIFRDPRLIDELTATFAP